MAETPWTPGPWKNRGDDFIDSEKTGTVIVEQINNELGELGHEEISANADLIAAAPDLYEALKAAYTVLRESDGILRDLSRGFAYHPPEVIAQIEAVLLKANPERKPDAQ